MGPRAMDVAEGVRWWGGRQRRRAEEALQAWLADDEEGLHDFRVALRRLLSVVETLAPELRLKGALRRRLRRLIRHTNAARDLEVAAAQVTDWAGRLQGAAEAAAREWAADLAVERDRAHEALRATLPRRWRRTARRLDKALEGLAARRPLSWAQAVSLAAQGQADALRVALAAVSGPADDAGLHRARLVAKRLRYLLEPFQENDDARLAVGEIKALQGILGELHDLENLRRQATERMILGCRDALPPLVDATFRGEPPPPWCPPPLLALVSALGARHRSCYGALEVHRGEAARWHGLAVSAAAVLREPAEVNG